MVEKHVLSEDYCFPPYSPGALESWMRAPTPKVFAIESIVAWFPFPSVCKIAFTHLRGAGQTACLDLRRGCWSQPLLGKIFLFKNVCVGSWQCSTCASLEKILNSFLLNAIPWLLLTKFIISQISTRFHKLPTKHNCSVFFLHLSN